MFLEREDGPPGCGMRPSGPFLSGLAGSLRHPSTALPPSLPGAPPACPGPPWPRQPRPSCSRAPGGPEPGVSPCSGVRFWASQVQVQAEPGLPRGRHPLSRAHRAGPPSGTRPANHLCSRLSVSVEPISARGVSLQGVALPSFAESVGGRVTAAAGAAWWGCGLGPPGTPPRLAGGPYPYLGWTCEGAGVRVLAPGPSGREWGWGWSPVPPCGEWPGDGGRPGGGGPREGPTLEAGGREGGRAAAGASPGRHGPCCSLVAPGPWAEEPPV